MTHHEKIVVLVNHTKVEFDRSEQTGQSIKECAHIPPNHTLCVDDEADAGCGRRDDELTVVGDDEAVHLRGGKHFWSIAPAGHGITVTINAKPYEFASARQSGKTLKERAAIPSTDVLFRDRPGEDEVIPDDAKIVIKCGDQFHSSPPANYGSCATLTAHDVGHATFETVNQPDGWTFLVVPNYPLPDGFLPHATRLLIKLPPLFPDAAPDMFWVNPHVRTESGRAPQGTATEQLMGSEWQSFSWHLQAGAWKPGISTLRDYMRCVRARFEKRY